MPKIKSTVHPWLLAITSVTVCLFSALFFVHHDIRFVAWWAHFVPEDWNFYEAVARIDPEKLKWVAYPPLYIWFLGLWMKLGHACFGFFDYPLWNDMMKVVLWDKTPQFKPLENLFLRLPYIPLHLGIAYFGARLMGASWNSRIFWLLLLQPIPLFISFTMGQIDIVPTFFSVLAVFLLVRRPASWIPLAFLSLAVGTMTKSYPLILLAAAFFPVLMSDPSRRRWTLSASVGFAAFIALVLGLVWGPAFRTSFMMLPKFPLVYRSFQIGVFNMNGDWAAYLAVLVLAFSALSIRRWGSLRGYLKTAATALNRLRDPGVRDAFILLLPALVLSLLFFNRRWHPQYLTWFAPWMILSAYAVAEAWPKESLFRTWSARFPLLFNLAYFPVVFASYSRNVDSNIFLYSSGKTTLGEALAWARVPSFFLVSALFLLWAVLLAATVWRVADSGWVYDPRRNREPSWRTVWGHFSIFAAVIVASLIYAIR